MESNQWVPQTRPQNCVGTSLNHDLDCFFNAIKREFSMGFVNSRRGREPSAREPFHFKQMSLSKEAFPWVVSADFVVKDAEWDNSYQLRYGKRVFSSAVSANFVLKDVGRRHIFCKEAFSWVVSANFVLKAAQGDNSFWLRFCKEAFSSVVSADFVLKDARGHNYFRNGRRKQILFFSRRMTTTCSSPPPFDVFINHRGMDTKLNVATLLFDSFIHRNLNPFLDYRSLKPGEELKEVMETAIRDCKVGVVIFSPNYCTSDNCLRELALLMEYKKKVIPIFYDVNPSDLVLVHDGTFPAKQLHRFGLALELAKGRMGISFDSSKGDWPDLIKRVSDSVVRILMELEVAGG